jgi:PST family polysaccharide transporter
VPAVQVGYQIGDVLMPAFAQLDPPQRREALVRSTGLLALIIFPLALGLGAVAEDVVTVLGAQYHDVAPMLAVLCTLAIGSPIGWTIAAYLQTLGRTRVIMVLEVVKLVVLLGTMYVLARAAGPVAACGAAGVAFALHALASLWAVHRIDQVRFGAVVVGCLRPLLACLPMVAGVLVVRRLLPRPDVVPAVRMMVELAVGALAYVASAFAVAGDAARELLRLVADVVRRRRARGAEA